MRMLPATLAASLALALPSAATAQASAAIAAGTAKPSALAPSEIVAAAPAQDWVAIAPADLLVMTLAPDRDGKPRQAIIQLMPPPFSQGWVGNIRKLAAAHWWDGLSINRVQDNYVVQWGDANAEDKAKAKALPGGLAKVSQSEYVVPADQNPGLKYLSVSVAGFLDPQPKKDRSGNEIVEESALKRMESGLPRDSYVWDAGLIKGWPIAMSIDSDAGPTLFPIHCYGMVGVGRDLAPDTGSGAELYTVIGHAPRHLDRNIALVGRVVEGIEHLSSLPRGTLALGFYETAEQRVPIQAIRLASELPASEQPRFEYLSTESDSFARYADARANRRDPFFNVPAGGADICNIPVPVRRVTR